MNGSDWPRPKLFTLLHELCHLAPNAGGLCDLHEPSRTRRRRTEDDVEHYCNQVAASALMPRARILAEPGIQQAGTWPIEQFGAVGQRYAASGEATLLRLVNLGVVP
jgi:Zn-dependent peptidase ImmA (M78 family)